VHTGAADCAITAGFQTGTGGDWHWTGGATAYGIVGTEGTARCGSARRTTEKLCDHRESKMRLVSGHEVPRALRRIAIKLGATWNEGSEIYTTALHCPRPCPNAAGATRLREARVTSVAGQLVRQYAAYCRATRGPTYLDRDVRERSRAARAVVHCVPVLKVLRVLYSTPQYSTVPGGTLR
jgi:hypothetical protein